MTYRDTGFHDDPQKGMHEYICINPSMDPSVGQFTVYSYRKPVGGMVVKIKGCKWQVWGVRNVNGLRTAKLEPWW